jgi:hypothetical protein
MKLQLAAKGKALGPGITSGVVVYLFHGFSRTIVTRQEHLP